MNTLELNYNGVSFYWHAALKFWVVVLIPNSVHEYAYSIQDVQSIIRGYQNEKV